MVLVGRGAAPQVKRWQTFSTFSQPADVDDVPCTCVEAGCTSERNGWSVALDLSLRMGAYRADYIRRVSRRTFTEDTLPEEPTVVVFRFPPGTPCFRDYRDTRAHNVMGVTPGRMHARRVRRQLLVVTDGPVGPTTQAILRKGRPDPGTVLRTHTRGVDFAEDLATNWNRMADQLNNR